MSILNYIVTQNQITEIDFNHVQLPSVTCMFFIFFFRLSSSGLRRSIFLLKGGHVIDPKNNIDSQMDVAIANGKILKVASGYSCQQMPKR